MTYHGDALTEPSVPRLALTPASIFAIALGGALGTLARFLLDTSFNEPSSHFPTTTLLINLSGSLAIGLLVPLVEKATPRATLVRPFLIVGILGGWTTYSTFAVDAVTLVKDGRAATSVIYLVVTLIGGTALVVLGSAGGRRIAAT